MSLAAARSGQVREYLQWCFRNAPKYLIAAAGLAAACEGVSQLRHRPISGMWVVAGAAGAAIVATAVHGYLRRPRLLEVASELDERLGLKTAVVSAIQLDSDTRQDRAFAEMAIESGERAAAQLQVGKVYPMRASPRWWWGAACAAGLALGVGFVNFDKRVDEIPVKEARAAVTAAKLEVAKEIPAGERQPDNPAMKELEQIEHELATGELAPQDAATKAAAALQRQSERQQAEAAAAQKAAEELREKLARSATERGEDHVSDLRRAIQSGDLESAAREAERLATQQDELSPQARAELMRDLRDLAQGLDEQASEEKARATHDTGERTRQGEAAPSQQQENRPESPAPVEPRKSEQQAPAEKPQRAEASTEQPRAETKPKDAAQAIRDAARRAADQVSQKSEPPPPKDQKQEQSGEQREGQPKNGDSNAESKPSSSQDRLNDARRPEPRPGTDKQPDAREQQSQGERAPSDRPSQAERNGTQTGKQSQGEQNSQQPQAERQGQQSQSGKDAGESEERLPSQQQSDTGTPRSGTTAQENPGPGKAAEPQNGGAEKPQPRGSQQDAGQRRGEQPSSESSSNGKGRPGGLQELANTLREAQKQSQSASEKSRSARNMQQRAQDILRDMDPKEREKLQRMAQQSGAGREAGAGTGPGIQPGDSAAGQETKPWSGADRVVDFRTTPAEGGPRPAERVISDIEKQDSNAPREASGAGAALDEEIRSASQSAERAIEQHAVAREHQDLVRRVFQRYRERAQKSGVGPPAADAPDAKSADPGRK